MLRTTLLVLLTVTLVSIVAWKPAPAQPAAGVSGVVVNGSTGGVAAGGLQVDLQAVQPAEGAVVASTKTDAAGSFSFAASQMQSTVMYRASVSYSGVEYYSPPFSLATPSTGMANTTVYETTQDAAAVIIQRMSVVLTAADRNHHLLNFVESYRVTNNAQTAYVGPVIQGEHRSLNFPLVDRAQSVVPLEGFDGTDAVATAGGFALSSPVLPGDTTIAFGYDVPFAGSTELLRRKTAYQTVAAQFVLPDGIDGTSPQLSTPVSLTLGSRVFRTIAGSQLAPGSEIDVRLSGLPAAEAAEFDWATVPLWQQCLAVLAVVVLVAGALLGWRRWLRPSSSSLRAERQRRLGQIARLDARFAGGALDADEYRRRRSRVIERVRQLDLLLRTEAAPDADEHSVVGNDV